MSFLMYHFQIFHAQSHFQPFEQFGFFLFIIVVFPLQIDNGYGIVFECLGVVLHEVCDGEPANVRVLNIDFLGQLSGERLRILYLVDFGAEVGNGGIFLSI